MNAVVKLAHAVSCRATLTSAAEWQRLAREALAEYDRVSAEAERLRRQVKAFGPKFQGMTELA
ncbi:MAG TPA: hypothetical protein VFS67_21705 [Polyangiaceae bacterium]|nr:hypothetical protein [Polyangiaceae bacterium]